MAALQALKAVNSKLATTQNQTSTGLRISEASHNAAYWSISITMRSDAEVLSTVRDALHLASALADVTYTALDQTRSVLDEIKARLVLGQQTGTDLHALQTEIRELAAQTVTIAGSATFAGKNWLDTDVEDIFDGDPVDRSVTLVTSYGRTASGPAVSSTLFDLQATSLFNADGGGILQADPRSPRTIGGIRLHSGDGNASSNYDAGSQAQWSTYGFSGPLDFSSGGEISFQIEVDADDPADGLSGGGAIHDVTIDRATVDAALHKGDGIVATYQEMIAVLGHALGGTGVGVTGLTQKNPVTREWEPVENAYRLYTTETSGLPGSSIQLRSLSSSLSGGNTGALGTFIRYGDRASDTALNFSPFRIYEDVKVSFAFRVNGASHGFTVDRAFIDSLLPDNKGWVNTVDEMATLVQTMIDGLAPPADFADKLDLAVAGNRITLSVDLGTDPKTGRKTELGFTGITVNIEPIAQHGILEIDVEANPDLLPSYLRTVEAMLSRVVDGAARVGALKDRIDRQATFNSLRSDAIQRDIGQLVDADMDKVSSRLAALQTQQQLAIQSLQIANSNPQTLLQLFR